MGNHRIRVSEKGSVRYETVSSPSAKSARDRVAAQNPNADRVNWIGQDNSDSVSSTQNRFKESNRELTETSKCGNTNSHNDQDSKTREYTDRVYGSEKSAQPVDTSNSGTISLTNCSGSDNSSVNLGELGFFGGAIFLIISFVIIVITSPIIAFVGTGVLSVRVYSRLNIKTSWILLLTLLTASGAAVGTYKTAEKIDPTIPKVQRDVVVFLASATNDNIITPVYDNTVVPVGESIKAGWDGVTSGIIKAHPFI